MKAIVEFIEAMWVQRKLCMLKTLIISKLKVLHLGIENSFRYHLSATRTYLLYHLCNYPSKMKWKMVYRSWYNLLYSTKHKRSGTNLADVIQHNVLARKMVLTHRPRNVKPKRIMVPFSFMWHPSQSLPKTWWTADALHVGEDVLRSLMFSVTVVVSHK